METLILKDASALGLNKSHVASCFKDDIPSKAYSESGDRKEQWCMKTNFVYGGLGWLYSDQQGLDDMRFLYLVIGKTPCLSFRARLGRNGYQQKHHRMYRPQDVLLFVKGQLQVEIFYYSPIVMDVLSFVSRSAEQDEESFANRYNVVVFSLKSQEQ